jgi:hypothetical protein
MYFMSMPPQTSNSEGKIYIMKGFGSGTVENN